MADLQSAIRSEEDSTMFQSAGRWEPKCTRRTQSHLLACLGGVCAEQEPEMGVLPELCC